MASRRRATMSIENLNIVVTELDAAAWNSALLPMDCWYKSLIRAFVLGQTIYLKKGARFLFAHSKEDLVLHEIGHMLGYEHRWVGVMAWHGLFRL